MTSSILPGRRALPVLLVLAPVLELVETLTSPLHDSSTYAELGHIADHRTAFVLSTMCGLVATLLYLPMFLGLAEACRPASPRLAAVAGWVAATSIACFVGVRMVGAVELQDVRDGVARRPAADVVDHLFGNPVGTTILVLFLLGALVGLTCLGVLVWRAGLPKPAAVLLVLFQPVDLGPGPLCTVLSHVLLLVALGWIALAVSRRVTQTAGLGSIQDLSIVSLDDNPATNHPAGDNRFAPAPASP